MSEFGKVLKGIRLKNGDTLRGFGDKIGLVFTYVDKIEKGEIKVSKTNLEKIIKEYPTEKTILLNAYLKDVFPESEQKYIANIFKNYDKSEDIYDLLFKNLEKEQKKDFLLALLEKVELQSFKNGNLERDREKLDRVRELINSL